MSLDAADEEILLKLAMSEAGGESTEGKALVMLSVVNRVPHIWTPASGYLYTA